MAKLTKSKDKKIKGVCSGIANWLKIETVAIRILYVVLAFVSGIIPLMVIYALLSFILPNEDD